MNQLVEILESALVFALIAGVFVAVFVLSRRGRKKNQQTADGYAELARVAQENGWAYAPQAYGRIDQYCGAAAMPGSGSGLRAWHHTTGELRGRSFTFFEHRYVNPGSTHEAGEARTPTVNAIFVVTAPGSAPSLEILQPRKLDAVLDRRERTEIGVAEFDAKFRVVTSDEGFARNVLDGTVVPFLLTDSRAASSPLQLRGDELFTWYQGAVSPAAVEEKLNFLCDVLDRIPAQSWSTA
ncbi:hypothetical protein [Streptomyces sp. cg35]|uniref:hypothetical protein n=1 Tax=Streptomyces sp. cg35 TaxID=3421650 RepID=UPI003D1716AD